MAFDNSSEFESQQYTNMNSEAQADLNYNMTMAVLPVTIFIGLECFVGLFGNVLILLIYTLHYRKSSFRCMVLTMAAIDLTSCLTTLPGEIFSQMNWYHYRYDWICKVKSFFNVMTAFASAEVLFVLAFDRYRKVCRPLAWQLQPSMAFRLCVGAVVVAAIVASPALVLWGRQEYLYVDGNLTINVSICEKSSEYAGQIYPFLYITFVYTLPLGVMMLMICGLNILTSKTLFCGIGNFNGELCKNASVCTITSGVSFSQSTGIDSLEANVHIDSSNVDACIWVGNNARNGTLRLKDIRISVNTVNSSSTVSEDLPNVRSNNTFEDEEIIDNANATNDGNINNVSDSQTIPKISDLECHEYDANDELNDAPITNVQNDYENTRNQKESLENVGTRFSLADGSSCSSLESPDVSQFPSHTGRHGRDSTIPSAASGVFGRPAENTRSSVRNGDTVKKRRKRKTLIMLVLTSLFVVTMLMYIIMTSYVADEDGGLRELSTSGKVVFFMFWRLYFINCLVNPVLYGFVDPRFRAGLRRLFTSPACCQRGAKGT